MGEQRGWSLPEQHLQLDALVAFVDGELTMVAMERAASHIARCPLCAAEATEQRQARAAVRAAAPPATPAGLLAALRAIPTDTDLPSAGIPDQLAVTADGQLVAVQRPERAAAALGSGAMLGSSRPLGSGASVLRPSMLRTGGWHSRRAVQGAGVVAAGLVLGALAVVGPHALGSSDSPTEPTYGDGGTISGGAGNANAVTNYAAPDTAGPLRAEDPVPAIRLAAAGHAVQPR